MAGTVSQVTGSTRVCDAHFPPTDFINGKLDRKTAKPVLHSWNEFTLTKPRRTLHRIAPETVEEPVMEVDEDASLINESVVDVAEVVDNTDYKAEVVRLCAVQIFS